jgi:hypothetical protein
MLRLLDSKTRIFFPSEEKDARFQDPLSSPAKRNHACSAFKRFFSPISLRRIGLMISMGQSLCVFDALILIYSTFCYHGYKGASCADHASIAEYKMFNDESCPLHVQDMDGLILDFQGSFHNRFG